MGAAGGYALYREAERRRGVLQKQFSQFLSPEVVRHLAETDTAAALKVEDREITAMLVDVRGFTAMSAALGADKTVTVVNHFLEIANREIFARGGTIDKYMGDAVLAFWNAPLEVADHADRAIDCARAMIAAVAAGNAQLRRPRGCRRSRSSRRWRRVSARSAIWAPNSASTTRRSVRPST
jgi:adenylate cyclase